MKFSARLGFTSIPTIVQLETVNPTLRNSLWNVLYEHHFSEKAFLSIYTVPGHTRPSSRPPKINNFSRALWIKYFKLPADERPSVPLLVYQKIREHFFTTEWYEMYDFLEFCIEYFGDSLVQPVNDVLEQELSGYRIIDGKVVPISSHEEITTVQAAIEHETFPGASAHISAALELLSNKTSPDYRNSIKESISAVESACISITGNTSATLPQTLAIISQKHYLHTALKVGFEKLYAYTSDGDGIRHAMIDEPNLTQADAIYFLVSCSAFVNYLKSKMTT